jgi:pyruvate-formate lyase-activating enzyme
MKENRVQEIEPFCFVQPDFLGLEGLPFFHVEPGMTAMQIGTKSCNAGCDYCINAHIAIENYDNPLTRYKPEELIAFSRERMAAAITFGINEVTVFLPSAIAIAEAAHKADLLVGCLTNGFLTEEAAAELASNMDMINVSLKSMSDKYYQDNLQLTSVEPVLRNIRTFHQNAHVEIITPVTQGIEMDELHDMMDFIEEIDPDIPWHLFRLYKTHYRINEKGRDFDETISFTEAARARLPYTYFSNFPGSRWVDTYCPECGRRVIRRISIGACGAQYLEDGLTAEDACPQCGYSIPVLRKR